MRERANGFVRPRGGVPLRRILCAVVVLLAAGGVLMAVASIAAGMVLSRPALRTVGPPAGVAAETLRIPVPPAYVTGWLARGQPGAGVVLLLHGVRADRRQMLGRAQALRVAGYSVLLIDLPAHGESPGERITYGLREGEGVRAALGFLRAQFPGERIGVVGVSLGAAALVLARPLPAPDAVVLESLYPTIEEAVANRLALRLGAIGPALAPWLLWQLPVLHGVQAAQLRPIDAIGQLGAPVLLASGTHDLHTPWAETERLHAAAAPPRFLWRVEGAAHQDLWVHDPSGYVAHVLPFLDRYLRVAP